KRNRQSCAANYQRSAARTDRLCRSCGCGNAAANRFDPTKLTSRGRGLFWKDAFDRQYYSFVKGYDFVVIGSGIAGLSFALKVAKHGAVAAVTERKGPDTNTAW